jgi:FixJ family two-component response regulator
MFSSNQKTTETIKYPSGILIDDSPIVALYWNTIGKRFDKSVTHYSNIEAFLLDAPKLPRHTYLYVDWYLSPSVDGVEITKQLSEMGFKNIVITTNAYHLDISEMPWIQAVISKDPPWSN